MISASLYVPAKNSILSSYGFTLPWGYDILRPWVQKNIPSDVIISAHPFDKTNLGLKNKNTGFSPQEVYSLAEHIDNKVSYVILNTNWANLPFYFWMNYDFNDASFLWNKPVNILKNSFHGLAAEELFRYQVHTVLKPWQSPDHNFVIVKIPQWPSVAMKEIKKYSFDKDKEDWIVRGFIEEEDNNRYDYDFGTGHVSKGSLALIPSGIRFPTVRITSPKIPVRKGYLYKISGYLKTNSVLTSKSRDGFIRLDFYEENFDYEKTGIIFSVSSRVYGTNEWVNKEIIERAPDNAKYLTVSFQVYDALTKIWIDDVKVFESLNPVEDITGKPPYTKDIIDLNLLYPNSHGNL